MFDWMSCTNQNRYSKQTAQEFTAATTVIIIILLIISLAPLMESSLTVFTNHVCNDNHQSFVAKNTAVGFNLLTHKALGGNIKINIPTQKNGRMM